MTNPVSPAKIGQTENSSLLSSLASFWSLIEPLLIASRARTLCEVGVGQRQFTKLLLEYCGKNGGSFTGVDPHLERLLMQPPPGVKAEFITNSSLSVLPTLAPHDVYFIDGDHNYFTVSNEVRLILQWPNRWPLVILHDVCWPWGRRDQYCSPESIPAAFRHPHARDLGVAPARNELGPGGFSGATSAYNYAAANHEGGPRNGVLTAVEDFLRSPLGAGWRWVMVPVVFGLGVMYSPAHCEREVTESLAKLAEATLILQRLLEILERNRVDLFLNRLGNLQELAAIHSAYARLETSQSALAEHERELRENYDRLLRHTDSLQKAYETLALASRPAPNPSQPAQQVLK